MEEEIKTIKKYANLYWCLDMESFFVTQAKETLEQCEVDRVGVGSSMEFIRVIPLEYTPKRKVKKEVWGNIYKTKAGVYHIPALHKDKSVCLGIRGPIKGDGETPLDEVVIDTVKIIFEEEDYL